MEKVFMHGSASWLASAAGSRGLSRKLVLLGLGLLLQSCSGSYQAPLDEQGASLERTLPSIYSTTGPSDVGGVATSTPASSSSNSAGTPARAVAAGVRVQPADGVNVNVVNDAGGILRSSIGRQPLGGNAPASATVDTPAPAASAPASPVSSAPTPSVSAPAPGQAHVVARGETLYSIAWQYSLDYRSLALANNLAAPYTIYPDQRLSLNTGGVSNNAVQSVPVVEDIAWQWPVEGRVLRTFSGSAATTSRGIDIGGRRGDPVYAAADGDVVYSGRGIQGQGDLIIIRHSARHLSAYSHNSSMLVSDGARIRAGDKIAEVGTDSRGTELLHFEVRVDGAPVDPSRYLPAL
jgi:lipoprotein NlpD